MGLYMEMYMEVELKYERPSREQCTFLVPGGWTPQPCSPIIHFVIYGWNDVEWCVIQ